MIDERILTRINPPVRNGRINEAELAYARWMQIQNSTREAMYREYRDYYDGSYPSYLTDRQIEYLQISANQVFHANYCPIVVDALAERLIVEGFDVIKANGKPDPSQTALMWQWWEANKMDAIQGDIHTSMIRDGDSFALVEWDNTNQRPSISHQLAYDGTSGVGVEYRDENKAKLWFAFKRWQTKNDRGETVSRLNIYTDSAVYKLIDDPRNTTDERFFNWRKWTDNGADPWPLPWVDRRGQPLGVPVIPFVNKSVGEQYGRSEILQVIPLQNALDKSIIDLLASADSTAFRIFKMIGAQPVDTDGNPLAIAPGQWIWADNKTPDEVTIDYIPGEDMTPLIAIVDSFVMRIAQVSRTPLSYFQASKQIASDDTQEANESGLISKVEDRAVHVGNSWESVMSMGRRLHNTYGKGGLDETALIRTRWGAFARVNQQQADRQTAETAQIRAQTFDTLLVNGVDRETAAIMAGYDQETAEKLGETKFNEIGDGIEQ